MTDPSKEELESCYRALGLAPGASLEDVESEYRFLAFMMHPDRLNPGPLQERAAKRLTEINNAREKLKEYSKNQGNRGVTPEAKKKESDETAHASHPKSEPKQHAGANPRQFDSSTVSKKYGPPPLPQSALYSLFDAMEGKTLPESFSAIAALVLIAFAIGVALIPFSIVSAVTGVPIAQMGGLAVLLGLVTVWLTFLFFDSETTVYRTLKNPTITGADLSIEDLADSAFKVVETTALRNAVTVTGTAGGTDLDSGTAWLEIKLERAGTFIFLDSSFECTLYLRGNHTRQGRSFVSCWLEVDKCGPWKAPLAVMLKATSEALRKSF